MLYVNKGRNKSKTKNSKKTNENSQKSEDHSSKYSPKDTSTERKTREISTSEMKRKRENLTLELTKPVEIIIVGAGDSTMHNTETEPTINPEFLVSKKT